MPIPTTRFNLDGYKDQQIRTNQLRSASIRIYSTASIRYKYASFSKEATSLSLRAHFTPRWQFPSVSPPLQHIGGFPMPGPPPFHLLIPTPRVLGRPHTGALNLKGVFSLCALMSDRERPIACVEFYPRHLAIDWDFCITWSDSSGFFWIIYSKCTTRRWLFYGGDMLIARRKIYWLCDNYVWLVLNYIVKLYE